MNKITTTAGLIAIGAVSAHAAVYAPPAGSQQATKPWSISATLRGFYDDNYSTSPRQIRRDSWGFEVSPSGSLNLIRDQTALGLSYVYSLRWYEDRDRRDLSATDQAHQVNAKISHAFTPRYKIDVSDSFVVAQEPQLIHADPGAPLTTFLRSEGDNLRNTVIGSFSIGITEQTTVVLGYSNQYYDYEEEGLNSRSAFLDRVEHLGSINLRQVLLPRTVGVVGYQYEVVDYNSPDFLGNPLIPNGAYRADERDSTSHYFYVGVDQGLTPTLNASLRVGAQYMSYDFSNHPALANLEEDRWSPYVDANATWLYLQGSYAQLGVRHQRAQTDVGFVPGPGGFVPNLDAESTTVYASVNHRIWGAFVASLIGQYQHSTYETDIAPDFSDDYFMAGVNLTYEINKFLAAELGYNYDRLDSELTGAGQPRSFTRNRVYVGIRGTY